MSKGGVVIKKVKKVSGGGHHGGAWKVAYADFVTAMMAFFLLMWLLNATTEKQKSGIADYFDPKVPISQTSAGGVGMFGGDSVFAQNKLARSGLGGSGKKAASGREENERYEVNSSEDVWKKGQAKSEKIGNDQFVGVKGNDKSNSIIGRSEMTASEIEDEIRRSLEASGGQGLAQHLNFKMTDEGLRIDITDSSGEAMFNSGSPTPTEAMKKIVSVVGSVISSLKNQVAITGHTDSQPFTARAGYSNWELSSERAMSARRLLEQTGFSTNKIKRIEGRADKEPIVKDDPNHFKNRRIGIILLQDNSLNGMRKAIRGGRNESFEQQELLTKTNRHIGEKGGSSEELFIPDPLMFR